MSDDVVTLLEPHALVPGAVVGPWLLLQRVDSGSYGVVFLAQRTGHPNSPPVALKLARKPRDPRFEREAQSLQRMHHPNLPRYEDSGLWTSPDGERYPYVVMECIEGFTLYDWFREQPRSSRGARPLTDTVAPPGTTTYRAPEMQRFMHKSRRDTEAHWHARASDDLYSLGVTAYRLVTGTYLPPITETDDAKPRKVLRPSELATVAVELEGTTTEIAEALERAAQEAGPAADNPILPTPAAAPTEKGEPSFSSRSSSASQPSRSRSSTSPKRRSASTLFLAWLSSVSAAVVGWLLVLAGSELLRDRRTEPAPLPPIAETWNVPHVEAPDAGVAEEVLLSAKAPIRVGVPPHVMGRPMPDKPFPSQRKPPCKARGEKAINGGCWVGVIDEKPPCGPTMFDYGARCYYPSYDQPPQPTSDQP